VNSTDDLNMENVDMDNVDMDDLDIDGLIRLSAPPWERNYNFTFNK
jgi:hypothetical protein